MAGNYSSYGVCRRCHSEIVITRKYDGADRRRNGNNCGGCWFATVAKPMIEHARRSEMRVHKLVLFRRLRQA